MDKNPFQKYLSENYYAEGTLMKTSILKTLVCPDPFRPRQKKVQDVKKAILACVKVLQEDFRNPIIMKKFLCIVLWIVYYSSPLNSQQGTKRLTLGNVMGTDVQAQSKKLSQGVSSQVLTANFIARLPVIIKRSKGLSVVFDLAHEILLSYWVTNSLRYQTSGFVYNFASYNKKATEFSIVSEKLGVSIWDHWYKKFQKPYNPSVTGVELFSWTLQILINLEIAQTKCFFTHFDLHGENILLRDLPTGARTKKLYVHNLCFDFKDCTKEPVIIDLGLSTVWYYNQFLGNDKDFQKYGMYNFYVPGADAFKFLSYCYLNFYTEFKRKGSRAGTCGEAYVSFFHHIIHGFYPHSELQKTPLWTKDDNKWRKEWFYNGTKTGIATFSPLDIIHWMLSNQKNLCVRLKINEKQLPFRVERRHEIFDRSLYTLDPTNLNPCIQQGLCSSIEGPIPNDSDLRTRFLPCPFPLAVKRIHRVRKVTKPDEKFMFDFYNTNKQRPLLVYPPNQAVVDTMNAFQRVQGWSKFLDTVWSWMEEVQTNSQNPVWTNYYKNQYNYLGLARWYVTVIGYLDWARREYRLKPS